MPLVNRIGLIILGLTISLGAAATMAADFVVVVSTKSAITSLTVNQVADIFLCKVSRFPNGIPVVPIDQEEGSVTRDRFYKQFTNKTEVQIKAYWSKIIFTGRGQPPKTVPDDNQVKELIANNPNAIGYIKTSAVDGRVKAVLVQEP